MTLDTTHPADPAMRYVLYIFTVPLVFWLFLQLSEDLSPFPALLEFHQPKASFQFFIGLRIFVHTEAWLRITWTFKSSEFSLRQTLLKSKRVNKMYERYHLGALPLYRQVNIESDLYLGDFKIEGNSPSYNT